MQTNDFSSEKSLNVSVTNLRENEELSKEVDGSDNEDEDDEDWVLRVKKEGSEAADARSDSVSEKKGFSVSENKLDGRSSLKEDDRGVVRSKEGHIIVTIKDYKNQYITLPHGNYQVFCTKSLCNSATKAVDGRFVNEDYFSNNKEMFIRENFFSYIVKIFEYMYGYCFSSRGQQGDDMVMACSMRSIGSGLYEREEGGCGGCVEGEGRAVMVDGVEGVQMSRDLLNFNDGSGGSGGSGGDGTNDDSRGDRIGFDSGLMLVNTVCNIKNAAVLLKYDFSRANLNTSSYELLKKISKYLCDIVAYIIRINEASISCVKLDQIIRVNDLIEQKKPYYILIQIFTNSKDLSFIRYTLIIIIYLLQRIPEKNRMQMWKILYLSGWSKPLKLIYKILAKQYSKKDINCTEKSNLRSYFFKKKLPKDLQIFLDEGEGEGKEAKPLDPADVPITFMSMIMKDGFIEENMKSTFMNRRHKYTQSSGSLDFDENSNNANLYNETNTIRSKMFSFDYINTLFELSLFFQVSLVSYLHYESISLVDFTNPYHVETMRFVMKYCEPFSFSNQQWMSSSILSLKCIVYMVHKYGNLFRRMLDENESGNWTYPIMQVSLIISRRLVETIIKRINRQNRLIYSERNQEIFTFENRKNPNTNENDDYKKMEKNDDDRQVKKGSDGNANDDIKGVNVPMVMKTKLKKTFSEMKIFNNIERTKYKETVSDTPLLVNDSIFFAADGIKDDLNKGKRNKVGFIYDRNRGEQNGSIGFRSIGSGDSGPYSGDYRFRMDGILDILFSSEEAFFEMFCYLLSIADLVWKEVVAEESENFFKKKSKKNIAVQNEKRGVLGTRNVKNRSRIQRDGVSMGEYKKKIDFDKIFSFFERACDESNSLEELKMNLRLGRVLESDSVDISFQEISPGFNYFYHHYLEVNKYHVYEFEEYFSEILAFLSRSSISECRVLINILDGMITLVSNPEFPFLSISKMDIFAFLKIFFQIFCTNKCHRQLKTRVMEFLKKVVLNDPNGAEKVMNSSNGLCMDQSESDDFVMAMPNNICELLICICRLNNLDIFLDFINTLFVKLADDRDRMSLIVQLTLLKEMEVIKSPNKIFSLAEKNQLIRLQINLLSMNNERFDSTNVEHQALFKQLWDYLYPNMRSIDKLQEYQFSVLGFENRKNYQHFNMVYLNAIRYYMYFCTNYKVIAKKMLLNRIHVRLGEVSVELYEYLYAALNEGGIVVPVLLDVENNYLQQIFVILLLWFIQNYTVSEVRRHSSLIKRAIKEFKKFFEKKSFTDLDQFAKLMDIDLRVINEKGYFARAEIESERSRKSSLSSSYSESSQDQGVSPKKKGTNSSRSCISFKPELESSQIINNDIYFCSVINKTFSDLKYIDLHKYHKSVDRIVDNILNNKESLFSSKSIEYFYKEEFQMAEIKKLRSFQNDEKLMKEYFKQRKNQLKAQKSYEKTVLSKQKGLKLT